MGRITSYIPRYFVKYKHNFYKYRYLCCLLYTSNLLEYPQYSRPEEWHGQKVPPVLLSGHHANIEAWRREQSILRTAKRRPDLLKKADLTSKEWSQVRQWKKEWKAAETEASDK